MHTRKYTYAYIRDKAIVLRTCKRQSESHLEYMQDNDVLFIVQSD